MELISTAGNPGFLGGTCPPSSPQMAQKHVLPRTAHCADALAHVRGCMWAATGPGTCTGRRPGQGPSALVVPPDEFHWREVGVVGWGGVGGSSVETPSRPHVSHLACCCQPSRRPQCDPSISTMGCRHCLCMTVLVSSPQHVCTRIQLVGWVTYSSSQQPVRHAPPPPPVGEGEEGGLLEIFNHVQKRWLVWWLADRSELMCFGLLDCAKLLNKSAL